MTDLKKMIASPAAHSRSIDLRTHTVSDDEVIVEGTLRDERYHAVFDLTGEEQAAGPIHQLVVRLLIRMSTMEIIDVDGEMIHVPHQECKETLKGLTEVIGLRVEGGFAKRVLQRLGGVKGCSHLTHLLTVMSQEVFQGIVVVRRKEERPLPRSIEEIPGIGNLVGSCRMWDQGGIKLRNLRRAMGLGDPEGE